MMISRVTSCRQSCSIVTQSASSSRSICIDKRGYSALAYNSLNHSNTVNTTISSSSSSSSVYNNSRYRNYSQLASKKCAELCNHKHHVHSRPFYSDVNGHSNDNKLVLESLAAVDDDTDSNGNSNNSGDSANLRVKPKMRVSTILATKDPKVFTISEDSTVDECITHLVTQKLPSSLVVNDKGEITGIYTARDTLSFLQRKGSKQALSLKVKDLMTTKDKLVFCSPLDSGRKCREIMFHLKIRNMPVIDNGEVLGIMTLKDLADSAFTISESGGKKGFINNVVGRKGLPEGIKIRNSSRNDSIDQQRIPDRILPQLRFDVGSCAMTHPYKKVGACAAGRRDYGADELCDDLSLCEDAHFFIKVKNNCTNTSSSSSNSGGGGSSASGISSSSGIDEEDKKTMVYMGVADGVGSWRQYGVDPRQFAHKIIDNALKIVESDSLQRDLLSDSSVGGFGLLDQDPIHPIDVIMDAWHTTTYDKITGSCTICIATLDNKSNQLSYSNIGDCGLMILRHIDSETAGYMRERQLPRHLRTNDLRIAFLSQQQLKGFNLPYQLGYSDIPEHPGAFETPSDADSASIQILPGDIILLGTDGLFDNLDLDEIVQEISLWEKEHYPQGLDVIQYYNKNGEDAIQKLAQRVVMKARMLSLDKQRDCPFAVLAKENDIMWGGGRPDDTTVVVARVWAK